MTETLITYKHNFARTANCVMEITKLIAGELELSALYSFKFLVKATATTGNLDDCVSDVQQLLGQRIQVSVRVGGSPLQTVHGLILSIESTTQYGKGEDAGWYIWTVRPELAKACYSLGRRVFAASELSPTDTESAANPQVLDLSSVLTAYYKERWNTLLTFSDKAKKRIPDTIQVRQNDESDYNFLARLLASWGLGYTWAFDGEREVVNIFDATDTAADRSPGGFPADPADLPTIRPVSAGASMWKLSFGVQNLKGEDTLLVENYNAPQPGKASCVSLHDESWDQNLGKAFARPTDSIHRSGNDNGNTCHGAVRVRDLASSANALKLRLGGQVTWATNTAQYRNTQRYYITRMHVSAANQSWDAIIDGRAPDEQSGLGVLPKPVRLNNAPDLSDEELIIGDAWPELRMRYFLAVVEDGSTYIAGTDSSGKPIDSTLPRRNLCRVREIAAQTIATSDGEKMTLANTLWVELGSPFADNDSGLLTRPRKGNVLLCLDRGDMSIPLAISSLFRDNNAAPFAELHTLNRKTRNNAESNVTDYSAVTLRNRTRVPARDFLLEKDELSQTELDLNVRDGSTGIGGSTATTRYDVQATRPISVKELASNRLPFNQIQMVSLDNGVQPVEQKDAISKVYLSSAVVETIAGMAMDMDNSSYVMAGAAKDALNTLNAPITRPHFEGISMYTNSDLLLQSADHQIINAGGEIVVTAAQAITLRVGRSSIRISEDGVEISCPAGLVQNPGAYAPYHSGETAQIVKCSGNTGMTLGGSIQVGTSGVTVKGPYVTNFATNMFKASTFLGSSFTVSDYAAKLYAPSTTIVGGAALVDSVHNLVTGGVVKSLAFDTSLSETSSSVAYTGPLVDGHKLANPELANCVGTIASLLAGGIDLVLTLMGHAKNGGQNYKNLVSLTGSLIKLSPKTLEEYAVSMKRYAASMSDNVAPLAGFKAIQTRAGLADMASNLAKVISSSTKTSNTMTAKINAAIAAKMSHTKQWKEHQDLFTLIQGILCAEATMEEEYGKHENKELDEERSKAQKESSTGKGGAEVHTLLASLGLLGVTALIEAACKIMISRTSLDAAGTAEETLYRKTTALRKNEVEGSTVSSVLEENIHAVNFKKETVIDDAQQVRQTVMTVDTNRQSVTFMHSNEIGDTRTSVQTVTESLRQQASNAELHSGVEQHA